MTSTQKHLVILGAGISGLSLAWFLKQRFENQIKLTLLEKNDRVGGLIRTLEKEGFLFELGPHSCRSKGNAIETLKLIEALQIKEQMIEPSFSARDRYLYWNQTLHLLPKSLLSLISSPLTSGLFKALVRDWFTPPLKNQEETVEQFISRRLSREIAERLIDPLTLGIYAGNIEQLSLKSCFPILYEWEQTHGSLTRGWLFSKKKQHSAQSPFVQQMSKHPIFTFKKGMETLPKELEKQLSPNLRLSSDVQALHFQSDKLQIICQNQKPIVADYLFSTLPANALANLLEPHQQEVSFLLKSIPHASIAVVCLGFRKQVLKYEGFGYLIPRKEKEDILGMIWDSSVFPQQNRFQPDTRLCVMIKITEDSKFDDFYQIALKALCKHLKINDLPDLFYVEMINNAIPQYFIGHQNKLQRIEEHIFSLSPRIRVGGSFFWGVSINDCIKKAKVCSENFVLGF